MSAGRLQIVADAFEAWNRGDYETATGFFSEDGEWYPHLGVIEAPVYRGRDALRALFRDLTEHFELRLDLVRIEELGNRVLVNVHATGRGAESGAPAIDDWFQLYTFSGEQICRVQAFDEREAAVEAATTT